MARLVNLIEVETIKAEPFRVVMQYWNTGGTLVFEVDPPQEEVAVETLAEGASPEVSLGDVPEEVKAAE